MDGEGADAAPLEAGRADQLTGDELGKGSQDSCGLAGGEAGGSCQAAGEFAAGHGWSDREASQSRM